MALGIGTLVGLSAGMAASVLDDLLMRAADIVSGLPTLLIALACLALFGASWLAVALVLGLTRWPMVARLVRVETMALRRAELVRAAAALGMSRYQIVRSHILPHVVAQIGGAAGIVFGGALIAETAVAFVGLSDPLMTSWGQRLANGFAFADRAWWIWVSPAVGLVGTSALVAMAFGGTARDY